MRFIHTSDWHLGRIFHQTSLLADQQYLLEQVFDYLKTYQADALIIAGDIYDRSVPPAAAVEVLDDFLHRVFAELKIPVLLISGNHDSAERLGFGARQLGASGLHLMTDLQEADQPVTLQTKDQQVDFFGLPYADPALVRSLFAGELKERQITDFNSAQNFLVEKIKQKRKVGRPSVLISHCFLDGAEETDSERPLSIGGADRVDWQPLADFSYVALGHLHKPQFKGREHLRYSGSLMKYSFSEVNQKKSLTLVDIKNSGEVDYQLLPLKPRHDLRILEGSLQELLERGRQDPAAEDYLLVRLTDTQALLEPMRKLREVYPQVLHLEKTGFYGRNEVHLHPDRVKRDEADMFADFYQQSQGESMSDEQLELVKGLLAELRGETFQ